MPKFQDLTNQTFGRLTVISRSFTKKRTAWVCLCTCGNKTVVTSDALKGGVTKSCGCFSREVKSRTAIARSTTHGKYTSAEYKSWAGMKHRCSNAKASNYATYGARGITFCERWDSFEKFYADMGDRPDGTSLDRIDNNGDYTPDNCRWATPNEQNNNTRSNRIIEFNGEKLTASQWASRIGISKSTFYTRINKLGWTAKRAIETPVSN